MPDLQKSFCRVTKDKKGHEIAHLYAELNGNIEKIAQSTPLHDETSVFTKLANVFRRVTKRLHVGDALVPVNGKNVPFAGESIDVERDSNGEGQCFYMLSGEDRSAPYQLKP